MIPDFFKNPALYLAAAIIAVGYIGFNKIEALSSQLSVANTEIATLQASNKEMKDKVVSMGWYHSTISTNQVVLDRRLTQLSSTLARESVIVSKPGLVTRIAAKQNADLEGRLACATGNSQYCP
ncbi:Rz-like spanin [Pectobacterium phage My1]|uniref:Uncharacterized protein n=1 Tax=Pectobacterium phage My1 TaxID=1204539 RepID=J9QPA4_9CAUD|nr:Rz-like spanin [Pectobacterium phage My1]AFQ22202.1 hypothetical protein My1_043 [Pectobacterium phage My1]